MSPELQGFSGNDADGKTLAQILIQIAAQAEIDSLTVSGGDPFEQAESLLTLLKTLRQHFKDILVYTGYTLSEIENGAAGDAGKQCLKYLDVLIDGRYVKELNSADCVLRGSANQKIHFFNTELKPKYNEYLKQGRLLESFAHGNETVIIGIREETP